MAAIRRRLPALLGWVLVYFLMVGVGYLLPVPGSDWVHHWQPRYAIDSYPPWIEWLLFFLPALPFLSGLTLTSLLFSLWTRKAKPVHILAAFSAMPLFWVLWLGQIDTVPLIGLAFLPWGIPIVLLKPQVGAWYVWAWWKMRPDRWKIFLGCLVFAGLTLVIWGWWPGRFTQPAAFRTGYDLSMWHVHWVLGALFLVGALLEKDPDCAMALGALAAPYIQGASYAMLLPALVRLRGWRLLLVWLTTWAGSAALVFGDAGRFAAVLFPITLWAVLRLQARKPAVPAASTLPVDLLPAE